MNKKDKKYLKDIQKLVSFIVEKEGKKERSITNKEIYEKVKGTSFEKFDSILVNTKSKKSKLYWGVVQAIQKLYKSGKIKRVARGEYVFAKVYIPKVCKAIQYQYESHCPKCDTYTYKILKEKKNISAKCPTCGKKQETHFFREYCPVRNTFIGKPKEQCSLLHYADVSKVTDKKDSGKMTVPMQVCYFNEKPTIETLEHMKNDVLKKEKEQDAKLKQHYYDKYHLHTFVKED